MRHKLGPKQLQHNPLFKHRLQREGQPHIYLVDGAHTANSVFFLWPVPTANVPTRDSVITQQIDCDHSLSIGLHLRRFTIGKERYLGVLFCLFRESSGPRTFSSGLLRILTNKQGEGQRWVKSTQYEGR